MKASDFPQEVLNIFDGYVHGDIGRREFLEKAGKYAVAGMSAVAMLEALKPNYAWAQQVPKNDPRIKADYVTYASPQGSGQMRGLLARPANAKGKLPAVVVIHENRGLNPYIEDVTRRLATEDFIAFAPDALTPVGGYPGNEEQAAKMFASLDGGKRFEDFAAGAAFVRNHAESSGKLGAIGFCGGGTVVNLLAVRMGDALLAGVPFYGGQPPAADVPKIKARLLIYYAENDDRINAGWPAYEAALKANGVKYEMRMFAGTRHGFHNDTTPRYDENAAKFAWTKAVAHFREHLKG
jgi:carboxymethylenebutenolidase